jgi:hypothetical protein
MERRAGAAKWSICYRVVVLPDLTDAGELPPGVHTASWHEFESQFGGSSPRRLWLSIRLRALVELARTTLRLHRIVAEVKFGSVTTHDVIVYAEKADRIRRVYPYLRYGFVLGGMPDIPGRVLRLGQHFDFIAALSEDLRPDELRGFCQVMQAEARASVALTEVLFGKRRSKLIQKQLLVK